LISRGVRDFGTKIVVKFPDQGSYEAGEDHVEGGVFGEVFVEDGVEAEFAGQPGPLGGEGLGPLGVEEGGVAGMLDLNHGLEGQEIGRSSVEFVRGELEDIFVLVHQSLEEGRFYHQVLQHQEVDPDHEFRIGNNRIKDGGGDGGGIQCLSKII